MGATHGGGVGYPPKPSHSTATPPRPDLPLNPLPQLLTIGSLLEDQLVVTLVLSVAATDHHGCVRHHRHRLLRGHVTLSGGTEVEQQARCDALQRQGRVMTHGVHRHSVVGLPPGEENRKSTPH